MLRISLAKAAAVLALAALSLLPAGTAHAAAADDDRAVSVARTVPAAAVAGDMIWG